MDLEQALRVSVIQAELLKLASVANAKTARVLRYAANVLGLLKALPS